MAKTRPRVLPDPQGVTSPLRVSVSSSVRLAGGRAGSKRTSARDRQPQPLPFPRLRAGRPRRSYSSAGGPGQSSPCLGLRHLEFSVTSGYAFFFFHPQGGAPTGLLLAAGRTAAPVLFPRAPLPSWDPRQTAEPGAGLCAARPALRHGLGPGTPAPAATVATAVSVSCRLGLRSTPGQRSRQPR